MLLHQIDYHTTTNSYINRKNLKLHETTIFLKEEVSQCGEIKCPCPKISFLKNVCHNDSTFKKKKKCKKQQLFLSHWVFVHKYMHEDDWEPLYLIFHKQAEKKWVTWLMIRFCQGDTVGSVECHLSLIVPEPFISLIQTYLVSCIILPQINRFHHGQNNATSHNTVRSESYVLITGKKITVVL